jgi:hypothetical protein
MSEDIKNFHNADHADVTPDAETADETPTIQWAADKDDKPKKNKPITTDALNTERETVLGILRDNPDAQILAVATDLNVPEERVLKYWVEWHSMKANSRVIQFSKIEGVLKGRLTTASGEALKADSPMTLKFDGNVVIITPYEKATRA